MRFLAGACKSLGLSSWAQLSNTLPADQGARENMTTYMALVPVVVGVIIASGGEPNFHVLGFTLAMLAVAGGHIWVA